MGQYQCIMHWKTTVKVKSGNVAQNDISTDVTNLMNAACQKQFSDTASKKGIVDYQLISTSTSVSSVSTPHKVYISPLLGFFGVGNYSWQSTIEGQTIVEFYDIDTATQALVAEVAALIGLAALTVLTAGSLAPLTTPAMLVIIGLIGVAITATSIVDIATNTAQAVKIATSSPASSIVTILMVLVMAIGAIGLILYFVWPKISESKTYMKLKNRITTRKEKY